MVAPEGHFLVGFVLGEKAVRAAHDSNLPDTILAGDLALPGNRIIG